MTYRMSGATINLTHYNIALSFSSSRWDQVAATQAAVRFEVPPHLRRPTVERLPTAAATEAPRCGVQCRPIVRPVRPRLQPAARRCREPRRASATITVTKRVRRDRRIARRRRPRRLRHHRTHRSCSTKVSHASATGAPCCNNNNNNNNIVISIIIIIITGPQPVQIIHDYLHWLIARDCILFKLCLLVYNAIHGLAPCYVNEMCVPVSTAARGDLVVPRTRLQLGNRAFCVGMLNDNRKIDYRIVLSESLSRFSNRLS